MTLCSLRVHQSQINGGRHRYTVEPPNKGHFGNGHFVLFSEAVPISEACHCLIIYHILMMFNDTRNDINTLLMLN